jgi:hypothetical protein
MREHRVLGHALALCALALAAGCGGDGGNDGQPGGTAGVTGTAGTGLNPPPPGTAGSPGGIAGGGSNVGTAGTGVVPTLGVPCGVAEAVSNNCTSCHGTELKAAAPMPLMTYADFQAPAKSDATRKVYELVRERINHADTIRLMPPPGVGTMSAEHLGTMNAWLDAGAVGAMGAAACPITAPDDEPDPDPVDLPSCADTDVTGQVKQTPICKDPDIKCYEFRAHAEGSLDEKYAVGVADDQYINFIFTPPWTGTVYTTSYRTLIDNAAVVHHWLFYEDSTLAPAGVSPGGGFHPDGELVHGWAPGGTDMYFAPDLGFELSGDVSYSLELHYNSTDASALDRSGVEVCYKTTAPENIVTMSWLGTDDINGTSAQGTCQPNVLNPPQRAHIVAVTPHMHVKGRHMKVQINRGNGTKEWLHNEPFDYGSQKAYLKDVWIEVDDTITTRCDYSEPTSFGAGTNAEMCYSFMYFYPPMALTSVAFPLHGTNTCLGAETPSL